MFSASHEGFSGLDELALPSTTDLRAAMAASKRQLDQPPDSSANGRANGADLSMTDLLRDLNIDPEGDDQLPDEFPAISADVIARSRSELRLPDNIRSDASTALAELTFSLEPDAVDGLPSPTRQQAVPLPISPQPDAGSAPAPLQLSEVPTPPLQPGRPRPPVGPQPDNLPPPPHPLDDDEYWNLRTSWMDLPESEQQSDLESWARSDPNDLAQWQRDILNEPRFRRSIPVPLPELSPESDDRAARADEVPLPQERWEHQSDDQRNANLTEWYRRAAAGEDIPQWQWDLLTQYGFGSGNRTESPASPEVRQRERWWKPVSDGVLGLWIWATEHAGQTGRLATGSRVRQGAAAAQAGWRVAADRLAPSNREWLVNQALPMFAGAMIGAFASLGLGETMQAAPAVEFAVKMGMAALLEGSAGLIHLARRDFRRRIAEREGQNPDAAVVAARLSADRVYRVSGTLQAALMGAGGGVGVEATVSAIYDVFVRGIPFFSQPGGGGDEVSDAGGAAGEPVDQPALGEDNTGPAVVGGEGGEVGGESESVDKTPVIGGEAEVPGGGDGTPGDGGEVATELQSEAVTGSELAGGTVWGNERDFAIGQGVHHVEPAANLLKNLARLIAQPQPFEQIGPLDQAYVINRDVAAWAIKQLDHLYTRDPSTLLQWEKALWEVGRGIRDVDWKDLKSITEAFIAQAQH